MAEATKRVEVCTCKNCGNEAEMVVTCELVAAAPEPEAEPKRARREKRTFACTKCGSEAEMIVDL